MGQIPAGVLRKHCGKSTDTCGKYLWARSRPESCGNTAESPRILAESTYGPDPSRSLAETLRKVHGYLRKVPMGQIPAGVLRKHCGKSTDTCGKYLWARSRPESCGNIAESPRILAESTCGPDPGRSLAETLRKVQGYLRKVPMGQIT